MSLADTIRILLVREIRSMIREINLFPDDQLVWVTPPGISNSAGTLAFHAAGNLHHFIGHILGGSGFVRDRDAEFGSRSATRKELTAELYSVIPELETVLSDLQKSDIEGTFPQQVGPFQLPTTAFLIHLCTHLAFHTGQMGYLRRILTGDNTISDALSLAPIAIS